MKICLITYDVPHRKTAQVFFALLNRFGVGADFLLSPFIQRAPRPTALNHRPHQFEGVSPRSLASRYGTQVHDYSAWTGLINHYDWFIVCGANILEPQFARCGKIVNCHSGLIPTARGLDSFKWAIYWQRPMGNTLHIIDEKADAGIIKAHLKTPVFPEDDLQTFATRHYENEIWMLGNFDTLINDGDILDLPNNDATMRMPVALEGEMMRLFEEYKKHFGLL